MKYRLGLFVLLMGLTCGGPLLSQQPAMTGTPDTASGLNAADLQAWLDGFMSAALEQAEIAGAVVSVVKDGGVLFSEGYGYADVAAKKPMDPARTLVRVGSTTKLLTWTAVMQLVEQDQLELDRDVNAYLDFTLPDHPAGPVTLNHLMTHRGGFEEGLREVLITDPARFISTERYLKEHPRPRIFPAGEIPAYSNYGTALAGYIVERISGMPFEDYVERNLLTPLEMQQSTLRQPLPEKFRDQMSAGYISAQEPPRAFELVTTAPAGSLSATADDMASFMIAHLQDGRFGQAQILKPATARLMHGSALPSQPGFATMAHGFFSAMENGRWVIGHGGDTILFHSDLNILPDEGVGIFVSFNSRGARSAVYGIRQQLFEAFMDRYFPDPEPLPKFAPGDGIAGHARAIAGRYESSRRIETAFLAVLYILQQSEVTANDDGTIAFATEPQEKFREVAPDLWRAEGSDHALRVLRENGRVTLVDSDNPTAVLQAVPPARNAALNVFIMLASVILLSLTLCAWLIDWMYRRRYRLPQRLSGRRLLVHRLTRLAALGDLAYLWGWYSVLRPVFESRLEAYGPSLDGLLRFLQIAALIPLAGAALGAWNAWLTIRSDLHWAAKAGSVLLAAALIGVAWIAWVGSLISFSLEY